MRIKFTHAPFVSHDGFNDSSLIIDSRSGYILPPPSGTKTCEICLEGYALYPALINAHDHLELNHFPRTRFRDVYPNAHVWGQEVSEHLEETPYRELRRVPLKTQCWVGGLKNLRCGVGTVAHHNPLHRPLRDRRFPVRVVQRYRWAHSLYFTAHFEIQKQYRLARIAPFMIHLAEGTDEIAARELSIVEELGVLGSNTVLIHGVGLTEKDRYKAIRKGASLVWCPSSNLYLLGHTASVEAWHRVGRLALGSDSTLTADGNLLDEMRAAHRTGQLDERALFELVTTNAARILGLGETGQLQPGMWADIIALPLSDDPFRRLVEATSDDIGFVICAGKLVWAKPALLPLFPKEIRAANFVPEIPPVLSPDAFHI